jgi:hypothetical protein
MAQDRALSGVLGRNDINTIGDEKSGRLWIKKSWHRLKISKIFLNTVLVVRILQTHGLRTLKLMVHSTIAVFPSTYNYNNTG